MLTFTRNEKNRHTCVHNVFIDHYMEKADGEYVKVYLMLLRMDGEQGADCTLETVARKLELTDAKVRRALEYWESEGLMHLQYSHGELSGVVFVDCPKVPDEGVEEAVSEKPVRTDTAETPAEAPEAKGFPAPDDVQFDVETLDDFSRDENVKELFYTLECYLKRSLSNLECRRYLYMSRVLKLPTEVIEYIAEQCISTGHESIHYITKVARNMANKGIATVKEAKENFRVYSRDYYEVMKAMGIRNAITPTQEEFLDRWFAKHSKEMILEAVRRTILQLNQANLTYIDAILKDWEKAGITTLQEAEAESARHAKVQEEKSRKATRPEHANVKTAADFPQRDIDYTAIELELLRRNM